MRMKRKSYCFSSFVITVFKTILKILNNEKENIDEGFVRQTLTGASKRP